MANESLNNNEKLPGILILFCISTVLGFLYNLASVLTMNNQFQWFYACYLIFQSSNSLEFISIPTKFFSVDFMALFFSV